jgi:hypothetical protein
MPSFALGMVIQTYLRYTQAQQYTHGKRLVKQLERIVSQDLMSHDIYFTEAAALNVAAGTYFCGIKQTTPEASLIPSVIKTVWANTPELQTRYPNPNNLTTIDNLLLWAKTEGYKTFPEIANYLGTLVPFNKREPQSAWDRSAIRSLSVMEPKFGAIGYNPDEPLSVLAQQAEVKRRLAARQKSNLFVRAILFLKQRR